MNDGYDSYRLEHFCVGMRIEMRPATDFWMAGARYGWSALAGRRST
jgi:hypothetical protein